MIKTVKPVLKPGTMAIIVYVTAIHKPPKLFETSADIKSPSINRFKNLHFEKLRLKALLALHKCSDAQMQTKLYAPC